MSDGTRRMYDRTAADWRTASDAAGMAGAPVVTIPVTQMSVLLFGYEQLKAERAAALKVVDSWNRSGLIDHSSVLAMWHALGVIADGGETP